LKNYQPMFMPKELDRKRMEVPKDYIKEIIYQYSRFAKRHDLLYDNWDVANEKLALGLHTFFRAQRRKIRSVLDCGCGTGMAAIGLKKRGYDVIGLDLSRGMLREALKNARRVGVDAPFIQGDWRECSMYFQKKFDCVMCRGNSLSHISGKDDLILTVRNFYKLLNENGLCYIGLRDWDRILKEKKLFTVITNTPKSFNHKKMVVLYFWDFNQDNVTINVIFIIKNGEVIRKEVYPISHWPISRSVLENVMREVGFDDVHKVDVDGDEINQEKYNIIIGYR